MRVNANDAADSSGQADEAVVEADPVEGGAGEGQVADVGDELEAAGESFPGNITCQSLFKSYIWVGRVSHFKMRLLSTTPSPSLRSMLASRCLSLRSVYSWAATLKTRPMAQKR